MTLPTEREGQSPFVEGTAFQFAWDSTSLGMLKSCPQLYKYGIIDGYRLASAEKSIHLFFGTVVHGALELYDHLIADGASHNFALEEVVDYVLKTTWIEDKPWDTGDSYKNRETLLRTVVWYLEHYENDNARTVILANGQPAVELSFRTEVGTVSGHTVYLCGHLDRVVDFAGTILIQDRKTTKSTIGPYYFAKFNPDNQMSLYTVAGKIVYKIPIAGVMIDACQTAVGFTAFGRVMTMRSESQLEEWMKDFFLWVELAYSFAKRGHWPKNEKSCDAYGGCQFRKVCSASPEVRQNFLDAEFVKTDPWNPLKPRGNDNDGA